MNSKLDSFNKDKVKCKKCKEYFDKENIKTISIKNLTQETLCKHCHEKWKQHWFKITRNLEIETLNECSSLLFKIYKEFLNEQ